MSDTLMESMEKLGLAIVPRKPTKEMINAGRGWREFDTNDDAMSRAWQAMVEVAVRVKTP